MTPRTFLPQTACLVVCVLTSLSCCWGQTGEPPPGDPATWTGKQIYDAFCSTCHGIDGRGAKNPTVETPIPDFTDCKFNSREPHSDWYKVVAAGGPARGLSPDMASWGDAFPAHQITETVNYIKAFCVDGPSWPPGELNFRRPDTTPKAFPENEVVLRTEIVRLEKEAGTETRQEFRFEDRFGSRGQWEVVLPFTFQTAAAGGAASLRNLELEAKLALDWSLQKLWILSAGFGVEIPTASRSKGFTSGAWVFQPQLLAGKQFGDHVVLQGRAGVALPHDTALEDRQAKLDVAMTWVPDVAAVKTTWLPGFEVLTRRNMGTDITSIFVQPQFYRGLSKRGHVAVNFNFRFPVLHGGDEKFKLGAFILWDFGDGVFWEGW